MAIEKEKQPQLEEACFHSEKDRLIYLDLFSRLGNRVSTGEISIETYKNAIDGLNFLVPKRNPQGLRVIGDTVLTPAMERRIKSRLDSVEVESPWEKLPEEVKKEIASKSGVFLEMTDKCTKFCHFCAESEKGPITKKLSMKSIRNIFEFLHNNMGEKNRLPISLQWGTDLGDAKWIDEKGVEYDLVDIAQMYWEIFGLEISELFISTGIPDGEAFRITRLADIMLDGYKKGTLSERNVLRISQNDTNLACVNAIKNILGALYDDPIRNENSDDAYKIIISENRDDELLRTGRKLLSLDTDIRNIDIVGIKRCDAVIIGTENVSNRIMSAASNEYPKGEIEIPVKDKEAQESYTIVHHCTFPYEYKDNIDSLYPDPKITKIIFNDSDITKTEGVIADNPHRALLRLVIGLDYFAMKNGGYNKIPKEDKEEYLEKFKNEFHQILSYMKATNWKNRSMGGFLGLLKDFL